MTAYTLRTTPEQDQAMINWIAANKSEPTDRDNPFRAMFCQENCATAVVNVLKGGGVIGEDGDPATLSIVIPSLERGGDPYTFMVDSPLTLQANLEEGSLSDLVTDEEPFLP